MKSRFKEIPYSNNYIIVIKKRCSIINIIDKTKKIKILFWCLPNEK